MRGVAGRMARSGIVKKRTIPGNQICILGQASPPRTAETIGDDDRDLDPKLLLQLPPQSRRGTIRIQWQQHRALSTIDIRYIHAAVRANESVPGFGDQHAALSPHDSAALTHRQLTYPLLYPIASSPDPLSC